MALFEINHIQAVLKLFVELTSFIKANQIDTVFVHNLGSFDGYFIYKYLSYVIPHEYLSTIIDNHNKFILIQIFDAAYRVKFIDSYRIFPVSLSNLCELFKVKGKLSGYNSKFNSLDLKTQIY